MKYLPTGKQMREADLYTINEVGISSLILMERAALKVVDVIEQEKMDTSHVLVVCGPGNNGGDGYAVARLLHLKGIKVDICFVGNEESRSDENKIQKKIVDYYQIPTIQEITENNYSIVIDAIFGIGLKREITGTFADTILKMNRLSGKKVAIDIPSGVGDELGNIFGVAFEADITIALAFAKRGVFLHPGFQYAGKIIVCDIGITEDVLDKNQKSTFTFEQMDLKEYYPKRIPNSHKGTYGRILLIVGSKGMSGAAYLSAKAAYAVGAGLVQVYTPEENRIILQQLLPEAIVTAYEEYNEIELERLIEWADVVAIGCGLGKSETSEKLVKKTLKCVKVNCVIDADALNIIGDHKEWIQLLRENMILTPHMKEMSRLTGVSILDIMKNRFEFLEEFTNVHQPVCVLKDARTVVASKSRDFYLNLSGTSAMAKAGAGDVLTGIIAGIAGVMKDCYNSACIGVYLHGLAGEKARDKKGNYSVLASDIIDGLSEVLKEM